jgi:hypothetical protein
MRMFFPLKVIRAELRSRLSLGSFELHTAQSQPDIGTPVEVPEPRMVRIIELSVFGLSFTWYFVFQFLRACSV